MQKNILPVFEPNCEEIRRYLELLFAPSDKYPGGLIEISNLYNSKFFSIEDIEKAADYVVDINSSGQNAYTTPGVLSPNTEEHIEQRRKEASAQGSKKKYFRALAENFYYSNVCWVDLDEIVNDGVFKEKYKHAQPNAYTVTSRTGDKVSAHFWWVLDEPCDDSELLAMANKGIIEKLGGDKGTHNCTRLMKIGGTVAHPAKQGRSTQQTTFKLTSWMPSHGVRDLIGAYPAPEQRKQTPLLYNESSSNESFKLDDVLDMLNYVDANNDYFDWLNVGMALHDAGAPFEVWDNWSAKGDDYPGTNTLLNKWNSFTKGRGVSVGTLYYHAHNSGFRFDNKTKSTASVQISTHDTDSAEVVDPETGEVMDGPTVNKITAKGVDELDLDNIPPRAWLFGNMAARKYVTMIGASPGAGKSIFTMQVGVAAASNEGFGTHLPQEDNITTWIYNNEEGEEELRRRLKGILMHNNISANDINGRFYMNSGEDRSICIARKNLEGGGVVHTPDYEALKEEVLRRKIDLLIVDPFAETHDVSENSNDEVKRVAAMYRSIAIDCNCAVILVHHTRKGGSNDSQSSEHNGNMDNLRGGGAQLGVVRRVFTLAKMDESAAKEFDLSPSLRRWYVRLDDAKSNITAPSESAEWFKFKSLSIGNGTTLHEEGDNVGVLVHKTAEDINNEEAEYTATERVTLLTRLARIFIREHVSQAPISKCSEMLLNDGYGKYKERKLRQVLPDYVNKTSKNSPIVAEGYQCFFDINEGKSKKDGNQICLHIKEISDF